MTNTTQTYKDARQKEMVKISKRIEKLLVEGGFALYPFIKFHPNGTQEPSVRLIDTKESPNEQTGNQEEVGGDKESDGATESESA